jgi:phenylacetate-coenzyme A ligase PaaK-like adenylate-forming protein
VKLPKSSRIILAGGWKQHAAQEVDKGTLYALVRKVLGVPEENINELFGAVEHPVFYNTCEKHHFHIPIYGRVLIRDPDTLEPLPTGRVGLVNLISPLMTATPTLSVMTDDLGYLTPGRECGCGIESPYLTILGRVGMSDIQTCAAGASELLGKGEAF